MKVELKPICVQLTEFIGLDWDKGSRVCALIDSDNDNELKGWGVVQYKEDGTATPVASYGTIKELIIGVAELIAKQNKEQIEREQ